MKKDKSTSRIRGTTPEIKAKARRLRHNMTTAEKNLWHALSGKKLGGYKFRAQQLNDYGYHVIRFRNDEVLTDLPSVLEKILKTAKELST